MSKVNDEPERFILNEKTEVFRCGIFRVNEQEALTQDKLNKLKVYTFSCANWVQVVPVTPQGKIILVEQFRFGSDSFTLEFPGGAVEKNENDLTMAVLRELEEETGFTSQRILSLPGFSPNAAIQSNRITYFIGLNCVPMENLHDHKDPFEKIKLHIVDVKEAVQLARIGKISNALSALAIFLAEPYISKH